MSTAAIVQLVEQRRRAAARDWAIHLASLTVPPEEAARIVGECSDADVAEFLRCYGRACAEDGEADAAAMPERDANAAPGSLTPRSGIAIRARGR